jgi:ERCC4-type nuclease
MPAEWADKLEQAGYDDLDSLMNASIDDLTAIDGIDGEAAARIIELATKHEEVQEQPTEEQSEEAETETQEEAQVE